MHVTHPACAGLDMHQRTVVACVLVGDAPNPRPVVETFMSMTADLLRLSDWLLGHGVTDVALEATGVSWRPIWNVREGRCERLLANPQHIKASTGHTTDVKDGVWIADLMRDGLLRGSFVPDVDQRQVRERNRLRTSRVRMRAAELNRLRTSLERANRTLNRVVSDIQGVCARQMLAAIAAGETDARVLAEFAKGKLRHQRAEREQALTGRISSHLRFLVAEHLATIEEREAGIARLSDEIGARLAPVAAAQVRLMSIDGVGLRTAQTFLSEVGADLSRFPTHRHVASWAG